MALPTLSGRAKKRDLLISIDLGGRTTKAVVLQRKADGYALLNYAVMDAPIYEKSMSAELLAEHLKAVTAALEAKTKVVVISLGVSESIVRHADMPQMPVGDMRQILKNNSKNYLQQDLPNHVFDCFAIANRNGAPKAEKGKLAGTTPKQRVLAAGARNQLIDDLQTAVRTAGLAPDHIVPGLIGPVNAFEMAMPEAFAKEVIALVDIGFKHTTICLLQQGELVLSRVVGIGGDRISNGLAEALNISYAEAEGIKIGMPSEVQTNLETLVAPLGRELRASIDFFEHQYDKQVSNIYVCGGTSRSDLIMQVLQAEMMGECKLWNPCSFLQMQLPPQQAAEIDQLAPQLGVAVGAALAAY
jgi:type IV pilus assembly protein PilM